MRLLSLTLEQFRNYPGLSLDLSGGDVHVFLGPNGSGKTNILESISILALTKSFLGAEEQDVKQWGADYYRVKGMARNDEGEETELEVFSQTVPRRQKACFRNGVRIALNEMVGQFPAVAFLPQDLSLFFGPPAERRRFLDQILCQTSPEYFLALIDYQKLLKQRNALLKSIADRQADRESIGVWDRQIADRGAFLTCMRLELLETFNLTLSEEVRSLGETWEQAQVVYQRSGGARVERELSDEIVGLLQKNLERDLILQSTTVGPHRDDWHVAVDGHVLSTFASRGQQRIVVLALLFLEASYLELRRSETPVILLDDIFSELDDEHRAKVLHSFGRHQVFMTGTHAPGTEGVNAAVWEVGGGEVNRLLVYSFLRTNE